MKLTIDFETRSACELTSHGAYVYAEHPSTEIMCMSIKLHDGHTRILVPEHFRNIVNAYLDFETMGGYDIGDELRLISAKEVQRLVLEADIVEAHNASFEMAIWESICVKRLGWPEIPLHKWRCSAAKAAAHSLPRALGAACEALELDVQKDKEGHRIMKKLCKPRTHTKKDKSDWHEKPLDLLKLFHYCVDDTNAEYALSEALRDLSLKEQYIWRLDHEINVRGLYMDLEAASAAIKMISEYSGRLNDELRDLMAEDYAGSTQVVKTRDWLKKYGLDLPDLKGKTVEKTLKRTDLNPKARRVLEIRASLSKSSTAKYMAVKKRSNTDRRLRGTLLYHGAGTGRWAGVGFQTQNLPRGTFKDMDLLLDTINKGDLEMLEIAFDDPMEALSTAIRGTIMAAPGHELMCADFSSIEARVLAWLAGEKHVLDAFKSNKDLYKVSASGIYRVKYDSVDDNQRQVGKVSVLACGYQGGWRAYLSMAQNYSVEVPEDIVITDPEEMKDKHTGKKLTMEKARWQKWAAPIVDAWREAHPNIVQFWRNMEHDAIKAVKTGKAITRGQITWGVKGDFLHCKLPSGRLLSYYKPELSEKEMPWGKVKTSLSYMSVNGYTRKWERTFTYGGKLVENIVQAVARDLMAYAMVKVEKAGYPIIMTVHDEIVSEVMKGLKNLAEYEQLMSQTPAWAEGCPVKAEGWVGKRYRK